MQPQQQFVDPAAYAGQAQQMYYAQPAAFQGVPMQQQYQGMVQGYPGAPDGASAICFLWFSNFIVDS